MRVACEQSHFTIILAPHISRPYLVTSRPETISVVFPRDFIKEHPESSVYSTIAIMPKHQDLKDKGNASRGMVNNSMSGVAAKRLQRSWKVRGRGTVVVSRFFLAYETLR